MSQKTCDSDRFIRNNVLLMQLLDKKYSFEFYSFQMEHFYSMLHLFLLFKAGELNLQSIFDLAK